MPTRKFFHFNSILLATIAAVMLAFGGALPVQAFQPFNIPNRTPFVWDSAQVIYWSLAEGVPSIARESMQYATQAWSDATGGKLHFEEGPGGIVVMWDEAGTKITDSFLLAYATFSVNSQTQHISVGRIVVNANNYAWHRGQPTGLGLYVDGKQDADLDGVLLHEVGHTLGLDHSDKNPSAIVGATGPGNMPTMNSVITRGQETLHIDDVAGIQSLYGYQDATGGRSGYEAGEFSVSVSVKRKRRVWVAEFSAANAPVGEVMWDCGNGCVMRSEQPTYSYSRRGIYTVTALWDSKVAKVEVYAGKRPPRVKKK